MRKILRLIALILATVPSMQAFAQSRVERAELAKQELLDLNFFHEGRGMITPPGLGFTGGKLSDRIVLGSLKKTLNHKFGIIVRDGLPVGLNHVEQNGIELGALGCAICHSGKAAGVFVPGLGNKNIDIFSLAQLTLNTWSVWEKFDRARHPREQAERAILRDRARHFLGEIANPKLHNETQGMVPTGIIRKWFFDQVGQEMDSDSRGQVKVPFLWGYGEKRKIGSFSDGFGYGVLPGWAVAVELVAGQTPDGVREYLPKIHHAEDVLGDLLPPKYPFKIDMDRAAQGEKLFAQNCAGCHGTYRRDGEGLPIFEVPKFIPHHIVKTDAGRLEGGTKIFRDLVATNILSDIIKGTDLGPGYMAPRLEGARARFPYLHNGSVPTLYDLLKPASERPVKFSLRDAGEKSRFDEKKLGLTANKSMKSLNAAAKKGDRSIYDTSKREHGNIGHEFGFYKDLTDEDRSNIIEFVKTL
ncbi:MAG TPA: c-type cytochrome [Bdellovibrionales bacterium]|nr:c-type cytochrome [Bdellovibrionales bacterium]